MIAVEWKKRKDALLYIEKNLWIYVSLSKLTDAPRFRGRQKEFEATQEEAGERATAERTTARKDASRNTSFEAVGRKLSTYRVSASEEERQHSRRKPKDVRSKQKQKDTPLKKSLEGKSEKTSPEETGRSRSDLPRLREQMRATKLEREVKQRSTKERTHTEGDAPRKNSLESARRDTSTTARVNGREAKRQKESENKDEEKAARSDRENAFARGALLVGERARGVSAGTTPREGHASPRRNRWSHSRAKVTRPEAS